MQHLARWPSRFDPLPYLAKRESLCRYTQDGRQSIDNKVPNDPRVGADL